RRGLELAQTVSFPSMASVGQGDAAATQLASVKAVSPGYPLRGSLRLEQEPGRDAPTRAIPEPGTVWVDANFLIMLGTAPGERVRLGEREFTIARKIAIEPDRGTSFMS